MTMQECYETVLERLHSEVLIHRFALKFVLLHQTSVQNKEISATIKAAADNNSQKYRMKLHTLWSPLKKDGYIGIIGYFDTVK